MIIPQYLRSLAEIYDHSPYLRSLAEVYDQLPGGYDHFLQASASKLEIHILARKTKKRWLSIYS